MDKEFRLKVGQYESKEKAHVEIVEQVEPKITIVTEENVLKTIAFLEQKKLDTIAEIDAEIATNQAMLAGIREVNKDATIRLEVAEDVKK